MWLGVDIGTGGSRALVVNREGRILAGITAAHDEMAMQQPLWAEQNPENWWGAASLAINGALNEAGIAADEVKGIGLSGQMHGLTLLDAANRVIRPALIWCDQRSQAQVDWVNAKLGRERVLEYIANPVLTGFTLPKLLWVRDHEPALFERVRKVLLPKDYVRFRLTGEYATDVSDASGTALFNVVERRWSTEMVSALGLDASILPRVYESPETTGTLSEQGAAATGLKAGIPVVGGGWRPGSERGRKWCGGTWVRFVHSGNVRGGVRAYGTGRVRCGGARPHLLPCGSGQVARDGSDAGRGAESAVVSPGVGAGSRL